TIAGLVRGDITARGRLKIASSGRLDGDATVGKLVVQEGGIHHGRIMVHPEGVPDGAPEGAPGAPGGQPAAARTPAPVPGPRPKSSPVEAARKLWGEFF
ncbi:MAG: polymer-forming cytoskeletal protein, partial [Candidatus Dormibacteraceae bacterium]